ncbi:MAG: arginine--tRNA ligase [Acidimicrobiia bacterium]|nr:arginine--tRNA ligase [Acidimicrobiia bacterium]
MSLLTDLSDAFGDAFAALGLERELGDVVVSQRPDLAQFQCNGALPGAKRAGRNPRELAQEVIDALVDKDRFVDLSIAGPGFINISLADDVIGDLLGGIVDDDRLGIPARHPERVLVDFGGYNVAKAAHVGHMRTTILGDALQRLARFMGHDVTSDIHLGDWGLQMGMLIVGVQDEQPGLPYFDRDHDGGYPEESPVSLVDLATLYPKVSAATKDDPALAERARQATLELQQGRQGYRALWQHFVDVTLDALRQDVDALGVAFDLWYGESTVADRVDPMIERLVDAGVAREDAGAVIVDVVRDDDKMEIPPFILAKSDGAALYTTTDLATIQMRVDTLGVKEIIYVVDARQSLHFEQVFRVARRAAIAPADISLEHVEFGTVNGPGGKPLRTRDGGLPLLTDLIGDAVGAAHDRIASAEIAADASDEERAEIARKVAVAALKFGDLINHRTSNYIFDLDRFVSFEGKTGPYLQYAAVRIRSIERRATEAGITPGSIAAPTVDEERALMLLIASLPEVVERAWDLRAPNGLAEYAFELSGAFNRFYEHCHILNEEDPAKQASWLQLALLTRRVLVQCLDLLGIEIPERM